MDTIDTTREQQTYARLAGAMFLLKCVLEGFGDYNTIISRGGAPFVETARYAAQHEVLWRFSLLSVLGSWFAMGLSSFALFVLLERVNKRLAQVALYVRLGMCFVGASAMMFRFAQGWLYRAVDKPELTLDQLRTLGSVLSRGAGAGIEAAWMLQAVGSLLFFLLLLRSGYLPRALARVGMIGSALLLAAAIVMFVFPAYINQLKLVGLVTLFAEIATALLLLLKRLPARVTVEARA